MAELPESRNASKRLFLWLPVSKSSLLKASNGYVAPGHYCSYLPGFLPGTKNRFGHYLPNPPQVTACPTLHGCKQRSVDPATTNKAPTYISGDTHLTVKKYNHTRGHQVTLIKTQMQTQTSHAINISSIIRMMGSHSPRTAKHHLFKD